MKNLANERVLLTGATGGIGSEIANLLLENHCQVGLVGRSQDKLEQLAKKLGQNDKQFILIKADISHKTERQYMFEQMQAHFGGIDMLINSAGAMDFTAFENQDEDKLEQIFQTNVLSPMKLCREILPFMQEQEKGHIVNIGSIFGSIAFAYFAAYSASKFALRGFSEALRRELADSPIKVSYIAPRAVKTSLNSDKMYSMAKEVKMNMDTPEDVAKQIIKAISKEQKDVFLGFPESLFVRINALLPRVVDMATRTQNRIAQKYLA